MKKRNLKILVKFRNKEGVPVDLKEHKKKTLNHNQNGAADKNQNNQSSIKRGSQHLGERKQEIVERLWKNANFEGKISEVRSIDALDIDYNTVLGHKIGDINLIRTVSYRCRLREGENEKRLVLTEVDWLDFESYQMKIEEADKLSRFWHHPNVVTLYSYWITPPERSDAFKTIYMLFEESIVGDLERWLINNILKPSRISVLKYIWDIAKGLGILHQSNVIHGGLRCTNLFISKENHLVLGPIKKNETELFLKTRHLLSKFSISRYMKLFMIYWAPEVIERGQFSVKSDIWAVGVIIFVLLTGEFPFDLRKEETILISIREANVNWRHLIDHPKIINLLKNILVVDPKERWEVNQILRYCQDEFIIIIQRNYRGYMSRKKIKGIMACLRKMQAVSKGWLVRKLYQRKRFEVRWQAAKLIQKKFREWYGTNALWIIKKLVRRMQAKVISKQIRRAFLKLRKDTISAQSFIRRFLVYFSYWAINYRNADLVQDMASKSISMERTLKLARVYFPSQMGALKGDVKAIMPPSKSSPYKKYEISNKIIEEDESENEKDKQLSVILSNKTKKPPVKNKMDKNKMSIKQIAGENEPQRKKFEIYNSHEDNLIKNELGPKYKEYLPEVQDVENKLIKAAKLMQSADFLPIAILGSKKNIDIWMQENEPYNKLSNILVDTDTIYRTKSPMIDFNLYNDEVCYVGEVLVYPSEPAPGDAIILVSNDSNKWMKVDYNIAKDTYKRYVLKGEVYCKYLRLHYLNNARGGNYVAIRMVKIRGIKQTIIMI